MPAPGSPRRWTRTIAVAAALAFACIALPPAEAAATVGGPCGTSGVFSSSAGTESCSYTSAGTDHFTLPLNSSSAVSFSAYGAAYGVIVTCNASGDQGYANGTLPSASPGQTFQINVGGRGGCDGTGGFNGGGPGGTGTLNADDGAGGNGASDVRDNLYGLEDRLVVGAGSGGGGAVAGSGGDGGYPNGGNGFLAVLGSESGGAVGTGGTQTAAGATPGSGDSAGFGFGGGGGGGWYGGGGGQGGQPAGGPGGGGSDYYAPELVGTSAGTNRQGTESASVTVTFYPKIFVTVTGSKTFGGSPSFHYTATPPAGVTLSGTVTCTTTNIGFVDHALPTGDYTIDGSSCSGLTASNGNDPIVYTGSSFHISPEPILVDVSGTQTWGGSPSFTYNVEAPVEPGFPDGYNPLSGTVTCTEVLFGLTIGPSLDIAPYTITGGNTCSGLTSSDDNFVPTYRGVSDGFVVSPAVITVKVNGVQAQGQTPHFFYSTVPADAGVTGDLTCTTVGTDTPIDTTLPLGQYTIKPSSCSGLTLPDAVHYVLNYVGKFATDDFAVTPGTITVTPAGTQTYGGGPTFTFTDDGPDGAVTGTLTCTSGPVGGIRSDLLPGHYSLTGCSGLHVPLGYGLNYATGDFVVSPATMTVTVSGSQVFTGGPTFSFTHDPPLSISPTVTVTCTKVLTNTTITSTLTVGNYTVDGSTCSGFDTRPGYVAHYVGAPDGFVVSPRTITATVYGEQTYGGAPHLHYSNDGPAGVVSGTVTCTGVVPGTAIDPTLTVGNYSVDGDTCSGVSLSDTTDYLVQYTGETGGGFIVSPATITANVSGSMVQGGTPTFTYTTDPADASVSGTLTCNRVTGAYSASALGSLPVGTYTLDGSHSHCSGLTPDDATNYVVDYVGVTNDFLVSQAPIHVHVSGTQTYGGTGHFTETDDTPDGVTLVGTVVCDTVDSEKAVGSVGVGTHTVDGSSCHGLSADGYDIDYSGVTDGYIVTPAVIHVHVSGTQTFGGTPSFTQTNDAPSGVTLSGSLGCDIVTAGFDIDGTLAPGTYTVAGTSCHGLSPSDATDFGIHYDGVTDDFVVTPATINVDVLGSQTYGETPHFTETDDAPGSVTLSGTLACDKVLPATTISSTLTAGNYTIDGTSCHGLSAAGYDVNYNGVTNGFVVSKATIHVHASGSQTYGGSPHFTQTNTAPGGITLSGTLVCGTVNSGTTIASALAAGTYTLDGSSCHGLSPSDSTDYKLDYDGVANGFTVTQASTSLLYTGQQLVLIGNLLTPAATLSSSTPLCTGKPVSFSLDADPTTGGAGPFALGSGASISTANWLEGEYTITASFAGTASCAAAVDYASLAVASPGDAASGGGWFNLSGSGRTNFGFNVRKVPNTTNTYTGQLLLINTGKWRIKGSLTSYGTNGTSTLTGTKAGSASGTGSLYWWNQALNNGLGGWQLAKSPVSFTINFSASSSGKKTSPGSFGIQISYKPVAPQPSTLPTSAPQLLKGGTVNVS